MAANSRWGTQGPWDALQYLQAAPDFTHFGGSDAIDGPYLERAQPWQVREDFERVYAYADSDRGDNIFGPEGPYQWKLLDCVCDRCVGGKGDWARFALWLGSRQALINILKHVGEKDPPPRVVGRVANRKIPSHSGPRPPEQTCASYMCPGRRQEGSRLCWSCSFTVSRREMFEVKEGKNGQKTRVGPDESDVQLRGMRRRLARLWGTGTAMQSRRDDTAEAGGGASSRRASGTRKG